MNKISRNGEMEEFLIHAMLPPLDAIDRKLIAALQEDCGRSTVELAEAVGTSQSACWRRIQRLRDVGVITGQVALVDRKKLGWGMQVFAHVKLTAHGRTNVAEFTQAVTRYPQVLECHILMGSVDCLLRIVAEDVEDFERFFFTQLSTLPGVRDVNSMVSLQEVKDKRAIPV